MERHGLRALIALLIAAACTKAPAPEAPRAPISTDRNAYAMRNGTLTIVATFTAPRTAYITNCNGAQPMGLQRYVNGRWVNAWVAELNGCFSAPIALQPGQKHTAPLTIAPGAGAIAHPIESGTYRVAWYGVLASYEPRTPPTNELPLEERVSAPFPIDVQHVTVSGLVLDASGQRVAHADVVVHAADDRCHHFAIHTATRTNESGEYVALLPKTAERCVLVDARSGGASHYVASRLTSEKVRVDVRLPRAKAMTPEEAHRLVRLLAEAINDPAKERWELAQFVLHGPEALRDAIDRYRVLLGHPVTAHGMELRGANGKTSKIEITQDDLVRLHGAEFGIRKR